MKHTLDPLLHSALDLGLHSHFPQIVRDETGDIIEPFHEAPFTAWDMSNLPMPTDRIWAFARNLLGPNFYDERTQPRLVIYAQGCYRGTSEYLGVCTAVSYASAGASKRNYFLSANMRQR